MKAISNIDTWISFSLYLIKLLYFKINVNYLITIDLVWAILN